MITGANTSYREGQLRTPLCQQASQQLAATGPHPSRSLMTHRSVPRHNPSETLRQSPSTQWTQRTILPFPPSAFDKVKANLKQLTRFRRRSTFRTISSHAFQGWNVST